MPIINTVIQGGGTTPTGTKSITANGVYDVTDYASADVQVPTTAPAYYIEKTLDANNVLQKGSSLINLNGIQDFGEYVLYYAYNNNSLISGTLAFNDLIKVTGQYSLYSAFRSTKITSVDMSKVEYIDAFNGCTGMFLACTSLTSVDLSSLKYTRNTSSCESMFSGCTNLTSVDLSSLEIIGKGAAFQNVCKAMFYGCTGLTTIDLSSVLTISGNNAVPEMFRGCTGLTNVNLSSLINLDSMYICQSMFNGCTNLSSVDLSSLIYVGSTNTTDGMFWGCTSLTNVNISRLAKIMDGTCLNKTFRRCLALTTLNFNGLAYTATNFNTAFANMLQECSGVTVHFPAEWQTTMSTWSNVTNGFGGTNTTVLFDLPNVTTLDLSSIKKIVSYYNFNQFGKNNYFSNITKVDLSNLVTTSGGGSCREMFSGCTNLTDIYLGSLKEILGQQDFYQAFNGCTGLTSVDLSSLETVNGIGGCQYMFAGCTGLTSLSFPALKTVVDANVFNYMLDGVTGATVHFPSNLSSYNFDCGGTNTTVLYDLPATA